MTSTRDKILYRYPIPLFMMIGNNILIEATDTSVNCWWVIALVFGFIILVIIAVMGLVEAIKTRN